MLNQKAPDFTLAASNGEQVSLRDLKGKFVVLIFYPANDTPTCNKQLAEANLALGEFKAANAVVFGVNPAPQKKMADFCTRKQLEFPILSDTHGQIAKEYNAHSKWLPLNIRTVVVIDPAGEIVYYQRGKPLPEQMLAAIKKAG